MSLRSLRPELPAVGAAPEAVRKLARLEEVMRTGRRPLVLAHDNPDPDSLAAAAALAYLLRRTLGQEARVAYGGVIGRAENQAMVRELRLPLVPVSRIVFDDYDRICLVDTQPDSGNHSLPPRHLPDVVVDHHPPQERSVRAPFVDLGADCGATSTMLARYLAAAGIEPPPQIATALFYGIKSDTRDLGRQTGPADETAYLWLFPRVDKIALGRIEHPLLPAVYFQFLHAAIERARRHGDVLVADLGRLYAPDLTAEVAEHFLFIEGIRASLALGSYQREVVVSLRAGDGSLNAGMLAREVCLALGGTGGGHASMAGARVPIPAGGAVAADRTRRAVARRFLAALGVRAGSRGRRLLDRAARASAPIGAHRLGPRQRFR